MKTKFTTEQLAAAFIAAEIAKIIVLQQWMTREEAADAEAEIRVLRKRQLDIETDIEMG